MISMDGIFYLKFAVSDIEKSVDFQLTWLERLEAPS